MGVCCSKDGKYGGSNEVDMDEMEDDVYDEGDINYGDAGARIKLQGTSRFVSMYSQQGKKGINQDSMTVWEDFTGEKEMIFCGVFDGHGPDGHKVSQYVRDNLPSKLSAALEASQLNRSKDADDYDEDYDDDDDDDNDNNDNSMDNKYYLNHANSQKLSLSSWESNFVKSFKEIDTKLTQDTSIDSYCSGSTAVTIVKQGDRLMIGNLGDSRAVLCTRGDNNQLLPIQLTVDMKPDIQCEAERIKKCEGRIFAADEDPDVYRVWMPEDDCPGLAMSRAFGDFCLKDCGLISIPEVSYRKLTSSDEFLVLATDGIWDVLSNSEVIRIVASAKTRCKAAKLLVNRAVKTWRYKYPCSKIDDCAVICLFFNHQPTLNRSETETTSCGVNCSESPLDNDSFRSIRCGGKEEHESVNDNKIKLIDSKKEWNDENKITLIDSKKEWNDDGISKANTSFMVPRSLSYMSWRKTSRQYDEADARSLAM